MEARPYVTPDPLEGMDMSFTHYVERRKREDRVHRINGIPDYAFGMDCELRSKLQSIPRFESICQKYTSTYVAQEIARLQNSAMQVGPNQYPELYRIIVDCAKQMGIGVPNAFVQHDLTINACTIAADDVSPILIINSGLLERFTPGEVRFVIGHECGHIHNQHSVFQTAINGIGYGTANLLQSLHLLVANAILMRRWSRAAEVTADRAGMICCYSLDDAFSAQAKLLYGAMLNSDFRINLDALYHQLERSMDSPGKIYEALSNHPSGARRIFMQKEFEKCELLYRWRPDLMKIGKETEKLQSRETMDKRCKAFFNVLENEGKEGTRA